jgi:acyl carrier protein
MIDPRFIAILRRHLPLVVPAEDVALDTPLRELGLDSMATVLLVVDLERELGVTLPERSLTAETFADAASVWRAVSLAMRS